MPIPAGELAALVTAVCWSLTALLFSFGGRRVGSRVVNRSRLLFSLGLLAVAHLVLEGTVAPLDAPAWRWGWLGLSAVLGLVIGDAALFQAYVLIGPRLGMLLMATVPIWSTVAALAIFGETVSGRELVGIGATVAGVSWALSERRSGRDAARIADPTADTPRIFLTGIGLALLGALGQAGNLVVAKLGMAGGFPAVSATLMRVIVAVAVLWGYSALKGELRDLTGRWRDGPALKAIVAGTFVGPFVGVWLSLYAISAGRIGIAATLMALPPVLLIPLEYWVHGTRIGRRGAVGTLVAFVGVGLILGAG